MRSAVFFAHARKGQKLFLCRCVQADAGAFFGGGGCLFLDPAAPFILRRAAGRGALCFEKRPAQCRAAEKERAGEQNDCRAP